MIQKTSPLCVYFAKIRRETGAADDERTYCLCGTVCMNHVDTAAFVQLCTDTQIWAINSSAVSRPSDNVMNIGADSGLVCVRVHLPSSVCEKIACDGVVQHVSSNSPVCQWDSTASTLSMLCCTWGSQHSVVLDFKFKWKIYWKMKN